MNNSQSRILFGRQIRALRLSKSLTQEALAEAAGLDRTYIGGIERGERNVSLVSIVQLADGLGVFPAELFSGFNDNDQESA